MFWHYKGGRSSAKRTGRLYPKKNPWYSLSEAESTSGHMVLSGVPWKKSPVTPPGIDPGAVRLVAQCLNHYATPDPIETLDINSHIKTQFLYYSIIILSTQLVFYMYFHLSSFSTKIICSFLIFLIQEVYSAYFHLFDFITEILGGLYMWLSSDCVCLSCYYFDICIWSTNE